MTILRHHSRKLLWTILRYHLSFCGIFKILSQNLLNGTEGNNQTSSRFFWTSFEPGVTPVPKGLVTLGAQRMLFLEKGSAFCSP